MKIIDVKIVVMSEAYAMITHEKGKIDVKLAAGKSSIDSLMELAKANRMMAEDYNERADLLVKAAAFIRRGASYDPA